MTRSQRGKKDFKLAAAVAILGFIFIAGGYLFLKLQQESFFPGGWLLASGLLLAVLAMVLGFLAKPKSRRVDLKTARREYNLYHSDKRCFEFDENGWKLFWYEGEDVRPWSCLRQIYSLETVIVLGTVTTYYWLPRAALEEARQLEHLRDLADASLTKRQLLFSVGMRPSLLVYLAGKMYHGWRRMSGPRVLCMSAAVLIFYWGLFG